MLFELLEGRRPPYDVVKQYRRKDGTVIWGHSYVSLVPGNVILPFILGSTIHVTRRSVTRGRCVQRRRKLARVSDD